MLKNILLISIIFPFIFGCQGDDSGNAFTMGKVSIEQVDISTAKVMWQSVTNDVTSHEEMGYEVYVSQTPEFYPDTTTLYTTVFGVTEVKIANLEIGQTYYVLLIAMDKGGNQTQERDYLAITLNDGENFSVQRIIHVTDAKTDLGLIIANSKQPEIITIHGTKNSQGNLTSVTDIIHSINSDDPTIPSKSFHYNFKKDSTEIIFTEKYEDSWVKLFNKRKKLRIERINKAKKTADLTLTEQNDDSDDETVVAKAESVPVPDSFLGSESSNSGSCFDKNCDNPAKWVTVCILNKAKDALNQLMNELVCERGGYLGKFADLMTSFQTFGQRSVCKPFNLPTEDCTGGNSAIDDLHNTESNLGAMNDFRNLPSCASNLLKCGQAVFNLAKYSTSMAAKPAKECEPTDNEQKSSGWLCNQISSIVAGVKGDPHLYTFDKLSYDFQAVGEFIFTKSNIPNDSFEVQVRLMPVGNRTDVSVLQAVAMNVGGDRVGLYRGQEPMLYINGIANELPENSVSLPNGGRVIKSGSRYSVSWPDGNGLVELRGRVSTIYLGESQESNVMGLLGNADGDPKNDITTRSGNNLGTNLDFYTLYPGYANSWRISQEESLFDYAPGENTGTFTVYNFPRTLARVSDLDAATYAVAEKICLEAGITGKTFIEECILDVALTGDPEFAELVEGFSDPQANINVAAPPLPQLGTPNFGQLNGSVYGAVNKPLINGAEAKLTISGLPLLGTKPKFTTNGLYQTDVVPIGSGYQLNITANEYISEIVFNLNVPNGRTKEVEPIYLIPNRYEGQIGSITGIVRNAINNDTLSDISINVRRYINKRMGEIIQTTKTDGSGKFQLENLNSGNYTLEVYDEEFSTNYVTATNIGGETTDVNIAMNPPLGDALYRIVLTWNNTDDLDAHLTGPNGRGGRFHAHFNRPGTTSYDEEPYAWLDRDDKDGFGPESVTISKLQYGGDYRYSVHDYINSASTSANTLANSGARVDVYSKNGLEESFTVPNIAGTLWTVFEIDRNGVIIPVNNIGYEVNQGGNYSTMSQNQPDGSGQTSPNYSHDYQIPFSNNAGQTDYLPITFQSTKN